MAENSFRSKYAGKPGSLVAIRVDYGRGTAAFDSLPPETNVAQAKRDVTRWKMGHRLGDKPEWNQSAQPEGYTGSAPQRANLHQLSEYQAVKLEYNYRAATLPSIDSTARFVPKPSKLQVDRSLFLSKEEKELVVPRNPGTLTALSRREMGNEGVPNADREGGWNLSTELPQERTNIYKNRDYADFRALNKAKGALDHSKYVPPEKRHVANLKSQREAKLENRETEARAREASRRSGASHSASSSGTQPVYKMSNINDWWDDDFDTRMIATASAVLGKPIQLAGSADAPAMSGGANDGAHGGGAGDGSHADP